MIYIYQHLGLGDHIITNGLVRSLIKNNLEYTLFCKPNNLNSVKFMYNDLKNLYIKEGYQHDIENFLLKINNDKIIKIGFYQELPNYSWDEIFYLQHNVPFVNRWDNFKINRNLNSEIELYNKLNPDDYKFALIHNQGSDGVDRIDYSKINPNLKNIKVCPEYTDNIFDYLELIYKAEEIHCVESCFNVLVDSLDVESKLFYHKDYNMRRPHYKNMDSQHQHKLKKLWTIV